MKLVNIEPLPEKKLGRPRTRPPKIEKHEVTPARVKALEKARAVKLAKRYEREKQAKTTHQSELTLSAFQNQGYDYGPHIDKDASLAKSVPKSTFYQSPLVDPAQLTRVENLLNQLISNNPPQNAVQEGPKEVSAHKSTIFNANPYLARRYNK